MQKAVAHSVSLGYLGFDHKLENLAGLTAMAHVTHWLAPCQDLFETLKSTQSRVYEISSKHFWMYFMFGRSKPYFFFYLLRVVEFVI